MALARRPARARRGGRCARRRPLRRPRRRLAAARARWVARARPRRTSSSPSTSRAPAGSSTCRCARRHRLPAPGLGRARDRALGHHDHLRRDRGAARAATRRVARGGGRQRRQPASPIVLPCHRVIGSDGTLTGYAGGLERKARLLRLEGVADRGRPGRPVLSRRSSQADPASTSSCRRPLVATALPPNGPSTPDSDVNRPPGLGDDRHQGGHVVQAELGLGRDVDRSLGEQHVGPEVAVGALAPAVPGQVEHLVLAAHGAPRGPARARDRGVLERATTCETWICLAEVRLRPAQAPDPRAAHQRRPRAGAATRPMTGTPSSTSEIRVAHTGTPRT